ncbi:endonuclease/exonuclease/phosphatase family protein [Janibacter anophelis]|uniref:endonuclease/exonuclease/phosphatase family protein n=1 Tax=Janibacter anophelis TaxID=319054 RepID=UPI003F7F40CA
MRRPATACTPMTLRVATWNLNNRGPPQAAELGELLRLQGVDLLLAQELNPKAGEALIRAAGLDWIVTAFDAGAPAEGLGAGRRRAPAIAGHGRPPLVTGVLPGTPLPERMFHARIATDLGAMDFAAYHAPPGVNWGLAKVRQAHALRDWIDGTEGPVIVGADANTPLVDHPDPHQARTHWHTGVRRLDGMTGDDVVFGGALEHRLRDAYRRWLERHPGPGRDPIPTSGRAAGGHPPNRQTSGQCWPPSTL